MAINGNKKNHRVVNPFTGEWWAISSVFGGGYVVVYGDDNGVTKTISDKVSEDEGLKLLQNLYVKNVYPAHGTIDDMLQDEIDFP